MMTAEMAVLRNVPILYHAGWNEAHSDRYRV